MRAFTRVAAPALVLDRADVDTDQIVPKQFLKRIERTGFGEFLFFDWRKDPGFELNRPEAKNAKILLAGRNFGCGSSREHAPWALQDYGFEVIVAPSFADIFASNCVKIGLVPIRLPEPEVKALMAAAQDGELTVDLEAQQIVVPSGHTVPFDFDAFERHALLNGLDDVGRSLGHEEEIAAYEREHPSAFSTTALP
ncbi:MAG TPA: 3-isopropylmalate dehydratase small subunit [Gaiellaceae bacterium]